MAMLNKRACKGCKAKLVRFPHEAARAGRAKEPWMVVACKKCHRDHEYESVGLHPFVYWRLL